MNINELTPSRRQRVTTLYTTGGIAQFSTVLPPREYSCHQQTQAIYQLQPEYAITCLTANE